MEWWEEEWEEEDEEYWDELEDCETVCGNDDECLNACILGEDLDEDE